MDKIVSIREDLLERAKYLKDRAKKEENDMKAKDMNGIAKGYLDAANRLRNYLENKDK